MSQGGYYRMHRGWMENPILAGEAFTRAQAWCWLIEGASFSERRKLVGSTLVDLQRGQLAAPIRFMAKAWGWEQTRVRRFLTRLETASMIATHTATGVTVITICNYEVYQSDEAASATPSATPTATEAPHQRHKLEKGNKGKNISIHQTGLDLGITDPTGEAFEQFWKAYPRKVGKGQARKAFTHALKKASAPHLIAASRSFAEKVEGEQREERFIPHASTWLNGERWTDEDGAQPEADPAKQRQVAEEYDRQLAEAKAKGPEALRAFIARHRSGTQ